MPNPPKMAPNGGAVRRPFPIAGRLIRLRRPSSPLFRRMAHSEAERADTFRASEAELVEAAQISRGRWLPHPTPTRHPASAADSDQNGANGQIPTAPELLFGKTNGHRIEEDDEIRATPNTAVFGLAGPPSESPGVFNAGRIQIDTSGESPLHARVNTASGNPLSSLRTNIVGTSYYIAVC